MPDLQTLFPSVDAARIEQASRRFFKMDREPGDVIVEEGEVHDSMFFIESGTVKVEVGGFEVAEMGPGSCIGEIGLFTTSVRTATVTAATPVTFHLLSRKAFEDLERDENPVAALIERQAIGQLAARLRKLVSDIRIVAPNAHSLLLEPIMTRQSDGRVVPLPESAIQASLSSMVSFDGSDPSVFASIAAICTSRLYEIDETISGVGRRDGPLAFLVSGRVDCLVSLEADQIRAAELSGGELFNVLPFVDGQPRPMSFVAAAPSNVLTIERTDARALLAQAGPVAGALRKAMIRSLADRVNQANATFSLAKLMRLEVDSATPMPVPPRVASLPPETPSPAGQRVAAPGPRPVQPRAVRPPPMADPVPPEPIAVPDLPDPVGETTPELVAPPEPAASRGFDGPDEVTPFAMGSDDETTRPRVPQRTAGDRPGAELPGFDPRKFVQPAPLSLVRQTLQRDGEEEDGGTPWFDSEEKDWDTWFDLTDEVSL